jgi:hypothetical protein
MVPAASDHVLLASWRMLLASMVPPDLLHAINNPSRKVQAAVDRFRGRCLFVCLST